MSDCATGCGRPAPDTTICSQCLWEIERDLGDVGALGQDLAAELEVSLSRQARIGGDSGGRRSAETPLPYDQAASDAQDVLRSALVGWVRELVCDGEEWPADSLVGMSGWLLARLPGLAGHVAADEAHDELRAAVGNARRAVDRPPPRVYAGPCDTDGCPGHVYGRPEVDAASCEVCGAGYEVAARRQVMRDDLDGRLFTAAEIAMLAVYFGETWGQQRARKLLNAWASRGLMVAHGTTLVGEPLFRFGDAVDRLVMSMSRAS